MEALAQWGQAEAAIDRGIPPQFSSSTSWSGAAYRYNHYERLGGRAFKDGSSAAPFSGGVQVRRRLNARRQANIHDVNFYFNARYK